MRAGGQPGAIAGRGEGAHLRRLTPAIALRAADPRAGSALPATFLHGSGAVPERGALPAAVFAYRLGLSAGSLARHPIPAPPAYGFGGDEIPQACFDQLARSLPPRSGRAVAGTLPFARLRASFRSYFANRPRLLGDGRVHPPESGTARVGGEARELDLVELVATVNSSFELTVGSWSA